MSHDACLEAILRYMEFLITSGSPASKQLVVIASIRSHIHDLEQIVADNRVITAQAKSYAQALKNEVDELRAQLPPKPTTRLAPNQGVLRAVRIANAPNS